MQSQLYQESNFSEDINQPQLMRLSQAQLNLLQTCPRKFQYVYLDQLSSPISPEQQERLTWGSRFHLLMQQRELGLPIDSLIEEDTQLRSWVTALVNAAPEILTPNPRTFRQSEHRRTLTLEGYLLTVIYDLLILDDQSAQILDWKTYLRPKNRQKLEKDWQTRLYLYVLAETSDYLPEKISMSYWFVQSQPEPKSHKFSYNSSQHEQTRQDLTQLLTQLSGWLEEYRQRKDLPQVAESAGYCRDCNFAMRCQRTPDSTALGGNFLPNLADIQEVPL